MITENASEVFKKIELKHCTLLFKRDTMDDI